MSPVRKMLTGNMAAAWGARASNVDYVCGYPITPQSEIVETLAGWVDSGEMKARFTNFDSEHSMLAAAGAASLTGARAFTATASQGMMYGLEMLYSIAGWRAPMVLVNVSRGVGMPMILQVEHGDVLAARDSGFIQLHAETCQDVLDFVLLGYRVGEDRRVMLPAIVNLDGFVLSFARERVEVPDPEAVAGFLPEYEHPTPLLGTGRVAFGPTTVDGFAYGYFKQQLHLASLKSKEVFEEAARDFARAFGREHRAVEPFMTEKAETVFLVTNSYSSIVRSGVMALRKEGEKVGMVKVNMVRPFPSEELARELASAEAVAVYEQNLAPGRGGILYPEVTEALYHSPSRPRAVLSFVGGLGGTQLGMGELRLMLKKCRDSAAGGKVPRGPTFLYRSDDSQKLDEALRLAGVVPGSQEAVRKDAG